MAGLRLTRAELEGIFGRNKFKEIKQFERLLAMAETIDESGLTSLEIAISVADSKGTEALADLSRVASALEALASIPLQAAPEVQDNLAPVPVSVDLVDWLGPVPVIPEAEPLNSRTITVSGDVAPLDYLILADATAGAVTVTLTTLKRGRTVVVKKTDVGVNVVTLASSANIDGAATQPLLLQYDALTVFCDGATWWII